MFVGSLVGTDALVVLILGLTAVVVVLSPRARIPSTVGLVLVGLLLNVTGIFKATLTPQLVFYVLLPIVIFEASFNLTTKDFFADWPRTVFLAFPGVGVMCVIVAYGVHWVGQPVAVAFLFSAIVAATDPVSVVAMFRDLGVADRLRTIIEAESIMNDGTGAVAYAVTLAILTAGQASIGWATGKLLWMCLAGIGIGGILAVAMLAVLWLANAARLASTWHVTLTLSVILAYGSFILADELKASGVLAAMTAGFIVGNEGYRGEVTPQLRSMLCQFWEYGAFFVNGVVFLLIGLMMNWRTILDNAGVVLAGYAFTLVARAVIVYGYDGLARLIRRGRVPGSWAHVLWWGGLRGTVPLALLLLVPSDFEGLAMIQALVYGTVLLSLVVEGLTIPLLVSKLKPHDAPGEGSSGHGLAPAEASEEA